VKITDITPALSDDNTDNTTPTNTKIPINKRVSVNTGILCEAVIELGEITRTNSDRGLSFVCVCVCVCVSVGMVYGNFSFLFRNNFFCCNNF